jgi:hypothetical protein
MRVAVVAGKAQRVFQVVHADADAVIAVLAMRAQRRQGGVIGHGLQLGRQVGQAHLGRQDVAIGRSVHLALGEQQRQRLQAQHVVPERVQIDRHSAHAPAIRMQRARGLVQARIVVAFLLLEMLGPQEQSFVP